MQLIHVNKRRLESKLYKQLTDFKLSLTRLMDNICYRDCILLLLLLLLLL